MNSAFSRCLSPDCTLAFIERSEGAVKHILKLHIKVLKLVRNICATFMRFDKLLTKRHQNDVIFMFLPIYTATIIIYCFRLGLKMIFLNITYA